MEQEIKKLAEDVKEIKDLIPVLKKQSKDVEEMKEAIEEMKDLMKQQFDDHSNAMEVTVQLKQRLATPFWVLAFPSDSVRRLKEAIKYPIDTQRLTFQERELDDDRRLCDYNIRNGSTICLSISSWDGSHNAMQVQVKPRNGAPFLVFVHPSDTVRKLKEEIKYPTDQQRLTFEGRVLENDVTLSDYNIRHKSVIMLSLSY